MKRIIPIAVCLFLVLELAACGKEPVQMSVEEIYEAMKSEGLPIGETIIYDETTDPNEVLGRPGKYIGKGDFVDSTVASDGTKLSGGTIEVFDDKDVCQARYEYLKQFEDGALGAFGLNQYMYKSDYVILRVDYDILPKDAEKYEAVFNELIDKTIRGKASDPANITSFDLDAYKNDVQKYYDMITSNGLAIGNVGTYMLYKYEAYVSIGGINYDAEESLESAYDWLENNSDYTKGDIARNHEKIVSDYDEMMFPSVAAITLGGEEFEAIRDSVENLYEQYIELYDQITEPPSNNTDFVDIKYTLFRLQDTSETLVDLLA